MPTEPAPGGPLRRTPRWLKIGVIAAAVAVVGAGGALAATAGSSGGKAATPPTTSGPTTSLPGTTAAAPTTTAAPTTAAPTTTTSSTTTAIAPGAPDFVACANPLPSTLPPGTTVTMNATMGSTQASMQGTVTDGAGSVKNVTLTVNSAGANPVSDPVPPGGAPGTYAQFGDIMPPNGGQVTSMCLAQVQAKVVVLAALSSGGAHCCTTVFEYPATAPTPPVSKDFGNAAPGMLIMNNRLFAQTGDNAFAYAFTDYAASGMPIKVMAVTPTGFNDVTRSFPKMISDDAAQWWKAYQSAPKDPLGFVAAWAADVCALGQCPAALAKVDEMARSGALDGAPPGQDPRGFPQKLRQFLSANGYS